MAVNPLLQILRALPPASLKALDKFIHSPYHVTHPGVVALYEQMKGELTDPSTGGKSDLTPHSTAKAGRNLLSLPPGAAGAPPAGTRLHHLTSYLLDAMEKFLALEIWDQRPHERHLATIEHLRRLRLEHTGAAMIRYARKRLEAGTERGGEFYRADYLLQLEAYYLSQQEGRARSVNVQELADAQDVAFICEKLRTGCLLLSHEAVAKREYDKGLLTGVVQFLENHRYLAIPAVAAYYHGYFTQLGENAEPHFYRLKQLLHEHADRFSVADIHDLYLLAINYCIRRINQADEGYFREVFELYRSGLRHGALLENGVLSRWTYNNIALTGLRLREFGWVRQFIQDFAGFLPEAHRKAAFNFNLARYHYDTGDYRQAMRHLLQMEYDDVLQNLVAKTMLCKIYFELEETDALENQLDSIQIYLRRKKVLGYHKDNYSAIVRYMRKLLAISPRDAAEKAKLRRDIEQAPILSEREWLLKRLTTPD